MRSILVALIVGASLFSVYATSRPSQAALEPTADFDLDAILEEALAEHPRVSARRNTPYKVIGNVVRKERGVENGLRSYRCEVSLVLMERKTGTVRALLSGRASGSGPRLEDLEPQVLRSAVRSALRRLDSLDFAR
ncbi:MAG: hypothetical protein GXY23_08180 [Myxococcales bacterium]|nr:hypothetical protein [Myxococcales bacterium]